jgi:hypothetical protein
VSRDTGGRTAATNARVAGQELGSCGLDTARMSTAGWCPFATSHIGLLTRRSSGLFRKSPPVLASANGM